LLCGDDSVKWEEFADAISLFASNSEYIRQLFNKLEQFQFHPDVVGEVSESAANRLVEATSTMLRKTEDGTISEHMLSLEAIITTLPGFTPSDPHDDIFAVLWLSYDGVQNRPEFPLGNTRVTSTPVVTRSNSPARQLAQQQTGLEDSLPRTVSGSASDGIDQTLKIFPQGDIEDQDSVLIETGGSTSNTGKIAEGSPSVVDSSPGNPWSGLSAENFEKEQIDLDYPGNQKGHDSSEKTMFPPHRHQSE
jgi:hypothetical protein